MNTRMLFPLALLLGCPGKTTPTTDTETTTTPEDTAPTGTEPEVDLDFPAQFVFMSADFGWDSLTSSVVNPTVSGFEIVNKVEWVIATSAFLYSPNPYAEVDEYCVIQMIFNEGPAAFSPTAQADITVYFGVDHSGNVADVLTNCNDKDHNVGELFGADIADTMVNASGVPWGLAIGSLSPGMIEIFEDNGLTSADYEDVVGARVYNTDFFWSPIVTDDEWYALPIALNETFEAQIDGNYYVTVPAGDVYTGASLATAWYRIDTWFGIDLGQTF